MSARSGVCNITKINTDLCAALGVDPNGLLSVTISFSSDVPKLKLEYLLDNKMAAELMPFLKDNADDLKGS